MMKNEDTKVIGARKASNPVGALLDAREKSREASALPLFQKADHVAKVELVQEIVKNFFKVYKGFYVNHRFNKGKAFTVVKVDNPNFPCVSYAVKQNTYTNPLKQLGVEVVFSNRTNSYLYRIPCE